MCDANSPQAQRVEDLELEVERAYQMLEAFGVPKERAKTVANGIDVLVTRLARDERFTKAMEADAARYRWLRDGQYPETLLEKLIAPGIHRTEVDSAIDAAMSPSTTNGEREEK